MLSRGSRNPNEEAQAYLRLFDPEQFIAVPDPRPPPKPKPRKP